jgi:hypothetical protein
MKLLGIGAEMPNKPLQAVSITSPGYFGLNNQDSGVGMNTSFAITTYNSVIDRFGRIGARKGWEYVTDTNGDDTDIEALFEFNNGNGTYTLISAGNDAIYTGETTLTTMPVRNSNNTADLTYTITANNWQIVQGEYDSGLERSSHGYLVQASHPALIYHKLGSTAHAHTGAFGLQRLGDMGSVPTGYTTTTFTPNCALAAYGRLWLADIGADNLTIYYSVLLDNSDFTSVGSGFINLEQVVPGGDRIVAMAEHNNFLIIFCTNNIVIYRNANDIDNLILEDVIVGEGCLARDSIQNIGTDLIYLSESGIRSLGRTIQEKSAPVRDLTKNIRDTIISLVSAETPSKIRSVYSQKEAFYLLNLPTVNFTICLDLRVFLQDGSARVTFWDTINPKAIVSTHDNRILLGKPDGIAEYKGYLDNGSRYTFTYYTPYIDFGDSSVTKILKKIVVTIVGGGAAGVDIKWALDYNTNYTTGNFAISDRPNSEYGEGEYGVSEYSSSVFIEQLKQQMTGSGNIVQIGVEALINGKALSIQKLDIYSVVGRTI